MAFAAGYAVNDVRRSSCKILPDKEFRFESKNDGGLTKKSTCVTAGLTARRSAGVTGNLSPYNLARSSEICPP